MFEQYSKHGIRFQYPAEWDVSEQREDGQLSVTVASQHTSFWTVTLLTDRPDPEDIVAAALSAFEEEYDELDVYPSKARVCRRPTIARDIDFVCLELLNVARLRAFRTPDFTVFVLYQGTDNEFDEAGPLLEKITKSLAFENGQPVDPLAEDDEDPDE